MKLVLSHKSKPLLHHLILKNKCRSCNNSDTTSEHCLKHSKIIRCNHRIAMMVRCLISWDYLLNNNNKVRTNNSQLKSHPLQFLHWHLSIHLTALTPLRQHSGLLQTEQHSMAHWLVNSNLATEYQPSCSQLLLIPVKVSLVSNLNQLWSKSCHQLASTSDFLIPPSLVID